MMLRVLLVDDHTLFRRGLRTMLEQQDDITVVAEAADGREAVAIACEHDPDVVVLDLDMPEVSGVEATRRILAHDPDARILILTMFDDDVSLDAALRAGALGYVLKAAQPQVLLRALHGVAQGEAVFGPDVARRLSGLLNGPSGPSRPFPELSDREIEVLDLIAAGTKNADIARRLYVSPKTVRNHITNIFAKLHVDDRSEAIVRARDAGLGRGFGS